MSWTNRRFVFVLLLSVVTLSIFSAPATAERTALNLGLYGGFYGYNKNMPSHFGGGLRIGGYDQRGMGYGVFLEGSPARASNEALGGGPYFFLDLAKSPISPRLLLTVGYYSYSFGDGQHLNGFGVNLTPSVVLNLGESLGYNHFFSMGVRGGASYLSNSVLFGYGVELTISSRRLPKK